ncbi:protein translocase subunit SecA-like isoform X2 [Carya illinoinensis]|uniref:protein translocase subunit SecA-like isoform X2 n=1 Tax=Carya illinoinensis TaxID=32201 RepID=UPI001C71F49C|nr:protein translocase subunit SecA-like isoform X2 [Carya illinoinensis]
MPSSRILTSTYRSFPNFSSSPLFSSSRFSHLTMSQHRSIFSTAQLQGSWMDRIKGVFTGQKTNPEEPQISSESFTLLRFADELKNARRLGAFKQYMVGRSSEATFSDAFEKQEAIIRHLGGFDPTGEFTWAKEAQKKIEKLKEEGKPMPKSIAEVQKLVGTTPLDLARTNLAKSGQISRNALCPCGSKKRYKRCCGKD